MKNNLQSLLLLYLITGLISVMPTPKTVYAYQEIKELRLLSSFLADNYDSTKLIYRYANEMKKQAAPFNSEKHRARYRFEPNDVYARKVLSKSREMASRFKLLSGVLHQSSVPNKQLMIKESLDSIDSLSVYSKRAIRAIKDNNYVLYLASAQGIEKEAVAINKILDELEYAINENLEEYDSKKDSL